jgi:hypothetical protein
VAERRVALSFITFIGLAPFGGDVTREMAPAPLVPEMPAPTTDDTEESGPRADGGERRTLPERTFGAPLVPDHR